MSRIERRGFLALGGLAAGTLAAPPLLRAQSLTTIADTLAGDTRFQRLANILAHASATEDFRQPQPITFFAPTDDAFSRAPAAALQDIMTLGQSRGSGGQSSGDSSDRQRWLAVINYHVVPGAFQMSDLMGSDRRLRTRNGADLQISNSGNAMRIANPAPAQQIAGFGGWGAQVNASPAQVVGTPVVASNGIIYPIDQILWP